jgi:hypothetical protein
MEDPLALRMKARVFIRKFEGASLRYGTQRVPGSPMGILLPCRGTLAGSTGLYTVRDSICPDRIRGKSRWDRGAIPSRQMDGNCIGTNAFLCLIMWVKLSVRSAADLAKRNPGAPEGSGAYTVRGSEVAELCEVPALFRYFFD